MALRDGLLLGEPDHGELRVDEDGARDHPVIHGARRLVGKGVVGGDASVLAADRGGHLGVRLGTDHVTRGVDVRHVGAQELVHLHLGSPVQRDPGLLDFDEVRVRAPPGRDKQIRCFEFQAAAVGLDRCHDAGPAAAHCTHLGAGEDAHSLAFVDLACRAYGSLGAELPGPWRLGRLGFGHGRGHKKSKSEGSGERERHATHRIRPETVRRRRAPGTVAQAPSQGTPTRSKAPCCATVKRP